MCPVRICVPLPRRLRRQLARLGFTSVADYNLWCETHGFDLGAHKTWEELEREWCVRAEELRDAARRERVDRYPVALLARVCSGAARASDFGRPAWRALAERVECADLDADGRRALRELVELSNRRGELALADVVFGGERLPVLQGLIALARRRDQWLRRPQSWRARTHNGRRQFASLARHLVARYSVPAFLDAAWLRLDEDAARYRSWFFRVGTGKRLAGETSPVPLTRRVAHFFLQAPESMSIEHALRRAQVLALDGDDSLVHAVLASRLGRHFGDEHFWSTVIAWFVRHPELSWHHVGPIVDYLQQQRFEPQRVFVAPGEREDRPPPQPNLTMRGRSMTALLREVEAWHGALAREKPKRRLHWAPSAIAPFEWETGQGDTLRVWRIRELTTQEELRREGHAMRHCVASYAGDCHRGTSSIWTLEAESFEGVRKHLTLEVSQGRLVECRGRANRLPRPGEIAVVRRWLVREGIVVATYFSFGV